MNSPKEVNFPKKIKPPKKVSSAENARLEGTAGEQRKVGKAAAYIRFSDVTFPHQCIGEDAQNAFLLELTQVRRIELLQMAARQGQVLDAWYEDLGCSGRGQFLSSRIQFEALTLAARLGKLSQIFAWDLSRLFRNLVQQELWLEEMEQLGVLVHIQDLPFAVDLPTRGLFRQELGMINEYQAARIGALFSAALNTRVAKGLWVGRTYSQWGLRYDAETKGFLLDEATAPRIRRLYALFNALGGSASQTARTLNREIRAGHPDALPPPRSRHWTVTSLMNQVRDPLYRRCTSYKGAEYAAQHLIPEVILPQVVAATDALLAAKEPLYEACAARLVTPAEPFLYARRLRCAECGGDMQAHPREAVLGSAPGLRVYWSCSDAQRGGACNAYFYLPQYRLTALLDRGLREVFAAQRERFFAEDQRQDQVLLCQRHPGENNENCLETKVNRPQAKVNEADPNEMKPLSCRSEKDVAKENIQRLKYRNKIYKANHARTRCLESYATGVTIDRQQVKERLAELEARQASAEAFLFRLPPPRARATPEGRWRWSEIGRLEARFEEIWPQDWWQVRDPAKMVLLRDLDLTIWAHIAPKVPEAAFVMDSSCTDPSCLSGEANPTCSAYGERTPKALRGRETGSYKPRRTSGLCVLTLSSLIFSSPVSSVSAFHLLAEPRLQGTAEEMQPSRELQAADLELTTELKLHDTDAYLHDTELSELRPLKILETGQELLKYKRLLRPRKLG